MSIDVSAVVRSRTVVGVVELGGVDGTSVEGGVVGPVGVVESDDVEIPTFVVGAVVGTGDVTNGVVDCVLVTTKNGVVERGVDVAANVVGGRVVGGSVVGGAVVGRVVATELVVTSVVSSPLPPSVVPSPLPPSVLVGDVDVEVGSEIVDDSNDVGDEVVDVGGIGVDVDTADDVVLASVVAVGDIVLVGIFAVDDGIVVGDRVVVAGD